MKKSNKLFVTLLIASVSSLFISCSSDVDATKLVGTWGCTHSSLIVENSDYNYNDSRIDDYVGSVITFNDGGTITIPKGKFFSIEDGQTWMVDGNNLLIKGGSFYYIYDIQSGGGGYSVSSWIYVGDWEIERLTKNELKIKMVSERIECYGEALDLTATFELEFKRQ
ncbi:MAG: hypothetical protein IKR33_04280 [Bacteroidales bacterium]|nr:hypothetical protein [Bacteroidales bacterium]